MRSPVWRLRTVAAAVALTAFAAPAAAHGAGVAYVDGNEIWVSSLDGTQKVRLSAGENDWREVAQSDGGHVIGIRLEANKIANLSSFTIWNPDGTVKDFGPLVSKSNGGLNAHPLSLEITPDAGLLVYGYSNYVYGFPVGTLTQGYHLLPSATRAAPVLIYSNDAARWPTLVGERIVGTPDQRYISVQDPGGTGTETFTPWIDTADEAGDPDVHRTDVAGTGTVIAIELAYYAGGATTTTDQQVRMIRAASLGGAIIEAGQCMLPRTGQATNPSLSTDASTVAWSDEGGVKVGGVPDFGGAATCTLTRPAVTISPTGKDPSLGPINVAAILAARTPPGSGGGGGLAGSGTVGGTGGAGGAGGGGTGGTSPTGGTGGTGSTGGTGQPAGPAVTFSGVTSLKLSSLAGKKGATVQAMPAVSGAASFTLTVDPTSIGAKGKKPITIATGKAKLTAGTGAKVKLRSTAAGKKAAKKLKKKKAKLTVTVAGTTTTITVTLK
ncbi:MAG: hypothetical protein JHD16_15910 [Solirubrobacteraceae bacterium]|nr:hypothetical protein [Solirubrobacteraceae bacterium]